MKRFICLLALFAFICAPASVRSQQSRVLVFTRTAGFRHSSIPAGITAISKLGQENGFAVDATEDASAFTWKNLARYRAVVFLNTTGDVLDPAQQVDFERYIQAGGGYVGIHSATDTEYEWPWYGKLVGARFNGHPNSPNVRRATFRVIDRDNPSTQGMPDRWDHEDEFYNFKSIDSTIHELVDIDEKSYEGGTNGDHHPMSWYHDVDGGRSFYTSMGHTDATFTDPVFLRHLLGGMRYAIGTASLDFSKARPEENRFTRVVLAEKLDEPIELTVLPDERVLFVERHGYVNLYKPTTRRVTRIATIPVSTKYTDSARAEDGLLGVAADPHFAANGFVYMYYSPAGPEPKNVLARFHMAGDELDLSSKKILLEIATQRQKCCHTGGSIAFDSNGNLYLSTGDNSNPFASGYAPLDERPGRMPWDAQKSSSNTNDLRGKIIRIHPEPSGTYTIPAGNLFPPGTPQTRPEIYTMGQRNPYRISVDHHSGFLYWGDIGPDANADSAGRGPRGYDELNQARSAGNYGWPYFVGNGQAYFSTTYADSTTVIPGAQFDPMHPVNRSPNNTGLIELPAARGAFLWYAYAPSPDFPVLGSGGRAAAAGPVFHRDDFDGAARPFPQYYDGKLFIYEFMRHWIMAITMDRNGDLLSLERFMPSENFSAPIEMEFGPSGDLYLLEYGTAWFKGNPDARLVRIEYNAGNRKPIVVAQADRNAGALPLRVKLSSQGTLDLDDDSLRYVWTIADRMGKVVRRLMDPNPSLTLTQPGSYTATLMVTDTHGARSTATVPIAAGNQPPNLDIDLVEGNRSFFFPGVPVRYAVRVADLEDGSLRSGRIQAQRVNISAQYLKNGAPSGGVAAAHQAGKTLIDGSDCLACHQLNRKSIGPTYADVAQKYRNDTAATARLVKKIREGGTGVWGSVTMPAHPALSEGQSAAMLSYILSLGDRTASGPQLPPNGEYVPPAGSGANPAGAVVLRAEYTDRGANGMPSVSTEKTVVLRSPTVVIASGELSAGVLKQNAAQFPVEITVVNRSGSSVSLRDVDLSGVSAVTIAAVAPVRYQAAGGTVEIHLDSATGHLLGESKMIAPTSGPDQPSLIRIPLRLTSGLHTVYMVFKNPDSVDQLLFGLLTATFESVVH